MSTSSKLTEPIIRVTDVSKVFGRQKEQALKLRESGQSKYEVEQATKTTVAIYNAHFEVKKGETFVLIGLSGSGKSTLLRCLNGLIAPTEGTVYLENADISHMPKRQLQQVRRNKIGMVFQNVGLLPNRTVIDNITFGLEIQGVSANERAKRGKEALEMVGLNGQAYKRIYELSGGMQQRVGLARALASEQEILLMDEPFSALDPLIRRDMQKLFLDIQGEVQKTVIFVTHDLDEALTLGHRAAVMKDGEIVQLGTAEDILSQPATDYVKLLVQDVNYGKIRLAKEAVVPVETAANDACYPRLELRRMRTNHLSTIFVLDSSGRLLGMMTIYMVLELIEAHKHDLKGTAMIQPHCVNPDMSLQEMIPLFTDSHSPVVIVDNHHLLQGMISPSTLIANLTERTAVTEQQEAKSYQVEVR